MGRRGRALYSECMEDLALTLSTLDRLEAERKLRSMPASLLESSWARATQREAVIDALLTVLTSGSPSAYAHARHVGEWSARIAQHVVSGPDASFLRCCGVLSQMDPGVLERLPEVRKFAPVVRTFQSIRMGQDATGGIARRAALIVCVADEFDSLAFGSADARLSPSDAFRIMERSATDEILPIVQALRKAAHRTTILGQIA